MAEILSSIDQEKEFEGTDIEACWNSFKDKIRDAVDKFIPISQLRRRKNITIYEKENNKVNKQEGKAIQCLPQNKQVDQSRQIETGQKPGKQCNSFG